MQNSPKNVARVAEGILHGRIAESKGEQAKAIRAYQGAVEVQDTLDYNEPADWFYPARESLAGAPFFALDSMRTQRRCSTKT